MKRLFHYLDRKGHTTAAKVVRAIAITVSLKGDEFESYSDKVLRMWKSI